MKKTTRLRQLFERPEIFILPGTANAWEAKIVESLGYDACYMSGAGTAAYLLGLPDAGLATQTEIVYNARNMAAALSIPLVSDADTGYGNAINVRRTLELFISAGVAGIHIEDQVTPKRCGYVSGKELVSLEEALNKYRAAIDARNELDKDFVLIARTDARSAVNGGLEEAITRAKAYRSVGMDVAYIEGPQSAEEVRACVEEVGPPIMFTSLALPSDQLIPHEELERVGASCAFYPSIGRQYMTYRVLWEYLWDVKEEGIEALKRWDDWLENGPWKHPPPPHRFDLLGFDRVRQWEEKYLPPEQMEKYAQSVGLYTPGHGGKSF